MKKRIISVLLIALLAALLPFAALAAGDGSGGGSNVGLALAESSVPDGSTDVAVDTSIVLTFNKNVVNMTVKDNNMGCFTLTSDSGAVAISVIMGDDQVDPDIRRIITIGPNNPLSPDTKYKLTISKVLMSKSGSTLSQDVVISFTTAGTPAPSPEAVSPSPAEAPSPMPSASASPAASSVSPSPSIKPSALPSEAPESPASEKPSAEPAPDTTATVPTPSPDLTPPPEIAEDTGDSQGTPVSPFVYIGGGAAVIVIGGTVWAIIRKRK